MCLYNSFVAGKNIFWKYFSSYRRKNKEIVYFCILYYTVLILCNIFVAYSSGVASVKHEYSIWQSMGLQRQGRGPDRYTKRLSMVCHDLKFCMEENLSISKWLLLNNLSPPEKNITTSLVAWLAHQSSCCRHIWTPDSISSHPDQNVN